MPVNNRQQRSAACRLMPSSTLQDLLSLEHVMACLQDLQLHRRRLLLSWEDGTTYDPTVTDADAK
jgi:hypothetical protein